MSQGHARNSSRFRIALFTALAVAGALTVHTLAAGQQELPTFRGEVQLIDVDVISQIVNAHALPSSFAPSPFVPFQVKYGNDDEKVG